MKSSRNNFSDSSTSILFLVIFLALLFVIFLSKSFDYGSENVTLNLKEESPLKVELMNKINGAGKLSIEEKRRIFDLLGKEAYASVIFTEEEKLQIVEAIHGK